MGRVGTNYKVALRRLTGTPRYSGWVSIRLRSLLHSYPRSRWLPRRGGLGTVAAGKMKSVPPPQAPEYDTMHDG